MKSYSGEYDPWVAFGGLTLAALAMDSATQNLSKADKQAQLDALLKAYQKLTDPEERAAFYHANPRLAEVYSALNHPPKEEKIEPAREDSRPTGAVLEVGAPRNVEAGSESGAPKEGK